MNPEGLDCYDEYYGEIRRCALCGRTGTIRVPLHTHHVFGGANRCMSEKMGMVVDLCHDCHEGPKGVHRNREKDLALKRYYQKKFEKAGHTREEFRLLFGKSWL